MKKRLFEVIQIGQQEDHVSRGFDYMIVVAIVLNIIAVFVSTFTITEVVTEWIRVIQTITILIFTTEFILRLWTADYLYPTMKRSAAVEHYLFSFDGIIDFLSFFPYYLPIFFPAGAVAFRMFRVIRILRLFREYPQYDSLNMIKDVLKNKSKQLASSLFIIFILMLGVSLLMFDIEHQAQPDIFKNAFSGFWWASSTLLTVGYGDIYPITLTGRILGILFTFLGVMLVAIPTGIISAGFVEQVSAIQHSKEESLGYCPYCGKKLPH